MADANQDEVPLKELSAALEIETTEEPTLAAPEADAAVIFAQVESEVRTTAISPDGRRVAVGLADGTLRLFDLISGTPVGQPLQGHRASVWSVAFSPDGRTIVSGSEDSTIRLWSLDGTPVGQPLQGHQGTVYSVAFSPDGKTIVSGSGDSTVRLWSLDGTPVGQPLQGHQDFVLSVAFSPDGKTIVSGSGNRTIHLWSLDGTPVGQPLQGHRASVWSVAFSPDGKTIVSGSGDSTIRLWSLDGTPVGQPLQGHRRSVRSVAFSPDGKTIVSGSEDSTIRLWSLDGTPVGQPLQEHNDRVYSVVFSPDGKTIVSGSRDTSVLLWKLDEHLIGQRLWVVPIVAAIPIHNLADRRRQISVPQSIVNDLAQGEDQLNVKDEIEALATVLMLRGLRPPVAVGILGSWGSGKSFGMYLIQQKVNEIRSQKLNPFEAWGDAPNLTRTEIVSPFVGHIYQIEFNAWTYAKSDLWASLMQEIFYELNRQVSLEQQLGRILSNSQTLPTQETTVSNSLEKRRSNRYIDRFIYTPFTETKTYILKIIKQIYKQFTRLIQRVVNFWMVQLVLHILSPILLFILITLYLFIGFFDRLTGRNFNLESKTDNFLTPFLSWLKFEDQITNYYFPDNLEISSDSWLKRIESALECILFLLFVGFPKRLSDRQRYWKQTNKESDSNPPTPQDSAARFESNPDSAAFGQALREGGEFWRVLYLMNEEERTAFLKANLTSDQFQNWKELTSSSEISNSLWKALDQIKREEQKLFKQKEQVLQDKEKELQRQLKSAEAGVNQQLAQRNLTALWTPLVNAVARLRFPSEKIEEFAASGETCKMLRQTITSWQGLLALFLMTLLIVRTLDAESRSALVTPIQALLEKSGLTNQINQHIPTGVKSTFTSLRETILTWLKNLPQWVKELQTKIPAGIQVITAIAATVTALIPVLKALGEYIKSVQKEQARIQSEREVLLKQEQGKAEGLVKEVTQLKLQVEEQRQRVGLTANYSSLIDFVNDRLSGDNYGKHLGLMQQVKQDLAALSDRLTDNLHNREELKKCFPRGPARVILYIDDLDRCPPNRVVEVLEAVQLLLNTKLFIVVLGIDDRYIARALEQVYQGVLKRGGKPSGIDYLEKIIQIPYRMRPISPTTVDSYLRSQLKLRSPAPATEPQPSKQSSKLNHAIQHELLNPTFDEDGKTHESTAPVIDQTGPSEISTTSELPSLADQDSQQIAQVSVEAQSEAAPDDRSPDQIEFSQVPIAQTTATPPSLPQPTPSVNSVSYLETIAEITEFDEAEFKILVDCCKHVDITPRTAKRLINIYKILQIIWSTRSQKTPSTSLPSEQDKRVVMSFLALSGRYPNFMRHLFEEIDVWFEENMSDELDKPASDSPNPLQLDKLLEAVRSQFTKTDSYAQREWRRFTSDIQRMLRDPQQPKDQSIELSLDRPTFDLILSFCFVGDIGYDPDDYQSAPQFNGNPEHQNTFFNLQ